MKKVLVVLGACILAACADTVDNAKEAVKIKAANPRGIEYRDIQVVGNDVVCGEFMEADRWGDGPGFVPFIVREGVANLKPNDIDVEIFCGKDPAAALQDALGIGPVNKQNSSLVKIYADLTNLANALEEYRSDFKEYPSIVTHKGLQALTKPRRGSPDPANTYISEIPQDPWGQDYVYGLPRLLHAVKDKFELYTLGKDGKVGGEGENADIGVQHLPYLNHIGGL